jgi:hypothetical protein
MEVVGGYFLFRAADYEAAVELTRDCSIIARAFDEMVNGIAFMRLHPRVCMTVRRLS